MSFRVALAAAATALMVAAAPAQAAITFDFTNSGGTEANPGTYSNSRTYTNGGVTMKAVGLTLSGSGGSFASSYLGQYGGAGFGVCSQAESCSTPNHQVDSISPGGKDFVLMTFTSAVDIESFLVQTFSSADTDVTYYLGNINTNTSLVNKTLTDLTSLGFGSAQNASGVSGSNATNNVAISGTAKYNAILVGTPPGQSDDAWKMRAISVTASSSPTPAPEPMSIALLATGLIGLGVAARGRRKA